MKILWLCNVPHPYICEKENIAKSSGGGWIISLFENIKKTKSIDFVYLFPSAAYVTGDYKGIKYYSFDCCSKKKDISKLSLSFKKILDIEKPDIIHVFGTENLQFYAMMQAADPEKTVVSIQGLISRIAPYCRNTLPANVFYGTTFHDLLRFSNPYFIMRAMTKRGGYEQKGLLKARYVTGRTEWDMAGTLQMAPEATYYRCGELLREAFYEKAWCYEKCEKHSIFITNSYAVYKGFHDLLNAMPYILEKFPDAKIYAIGNDPEKIDWFRESKYNNYIKKLMKKYSLKNKVKFVGWLDGEEMADMLCRVNVMVLPSAIENSPNSLGEAMTVGTPVVAANVGGVTDMLRHNEEGYVYRQNESYMLAHYICKVFEKEDRVSDYCDAAKRHAKEFFDCEKGIKEIFSVYNKILGEDYF